jgi:acyl-CoA synthetase (AMP-forming)/AMP-acid ligase II
MQQANRLSNALAAMGIARGDRVAILLPQRPETVVAYLACFQMGAIAVPLSFLFGPTRSSTASPIAARRPRWPIPRRSRTWRRCAASCPRSRT